MFINNKIAKYVFFILSVVWSVSSVVVFSQVENKVEDASILHDEFLYAQQLKYVPWGNFSQYPVVPPIEAQSYLLVHVNSGQVISNYNEKYGMPIASLTKIMTALLVFEAISNKEFFLNKKYVVREEYLNGLPFDASVMGLEVGDSPTGEELLKGLLVHSANDAANVIAFVLAGSIEHFALLMNNRAAQLRLLHTHFVDSSGLSPYNVSTAEDIARLSIYFLRHSFYSSITHITALPSITWKGRVYRNTNILIQRNKEVDGLKTGYTEEAGFHIVTTALRKKTRLLAVLMRVKSNSIAEGVVRRAEESWKLLQYGFDNFQSVKFVYTNDVKILGGKKRNITVRAESPLLYVPISWIPNVNSTVTIAYKNNKAVIWAPIKKNGIIGNVRFYRSKDDMTIVTTSLTSLESVKKAFFIRRIIDFFKN